MKVLAIVVTFNRSKLLLRCLNGIKNQSRPVDKILIVNNGSTDNTAEILSSTGLDHINQNNLGSAGGWNSGIKYALKNNFDYVWLMDDDGYPDQDALKILLHNVDRNTACISSIVVQEDMPSRFVFSFPDIDSKGNPKIFSFFNKTHYVSKSNHNKSGLIDYAHLFNGALISVPCIKKIGNVDKNYFMYGDEVDYYFRLKSVGKVVSSIHAIHFHPNTLTRQYSLMRIYYNIKNNIINYEKHYNFKLIRKLAGPAIIITRVLKTNGLKFVFSLLIGRKAPIFYKAIFRGYKKRIGHDYNL